MMIKSLTERSIEVLCTIHGTKIFKEKYATSVLNIPLNVYLFDIVERIPELSYWCEDFIIKSIKLSIRHILMAKYQSERIGMAVVSINPFLLSVLKKPSHKVCKKAIKRNYRAISIVESDTEGYEELSWIALKMNPRAIKYIRKQDEAMCWYVMKKGSYFIKYVDIQTLSMRYYAIKKDPTLLLFIRHQTEEMFDLAFKKDPESVRYLYNRVPCRQANLIVTGRRLTTP